MHKPFSLRPLIWIGGLLLVAAVLAAMQPPAAPALADPAPRASGLGGTPTPTSPPGSLTPSASPTPLFPTSTPSCTPVWNAVTSPNVGTANNYLWAVTAAGPSDLWAVGNYSTGSLYQPLLLRASGTGWQVVSSPAIPLRYHWLTGVAANAANDVWAVGSAGVDTFILHWDGSAWSIVPSPNPGSNTNMLMAVAVRAANDAWAVGQSYANGVFVPLILHWDGTAWAVVPGPNLGGLESSLFGVAVVAANDAWAVGEITNAGVSQTLILHWDGSLWSRVPSPNLAGSNSLYAVSARAGNDVWAVGRVQVGSDSQPLILHWDGTVWAVVPSPTPAGTLNELRGVLARAANEVWAVGQAGTPGNVQTLVLRWDGAAWTVVPSASPASTNHLKGVAAQPNGMLWAAGFTTEQGIGRTLIEHYSASCVSASPSPTPQVTLTPACAPAWRIVPDPDPGLHRKVDASGPLDAWAVGDAALHWDGSAWTPVPVPGNPSLKAVSAYSPNEAWAVSSQDIYRWNGSQWAVAPIPTPVQCDHDYNSVSAYAPGDVWVVASSIVCPPYIVHYTGGAGAALGPARGSQAPAGGVVFNLYDVSAYAPNTAWAVGYNICGSCNGTYILHLTGGGYTGSPAPAVGPLHAVVGLSATDAWAGSQSGVLLHWDGAAWTPVSAPNIGGIEDLTASGPHDVWAIGQTGILHWDGTSWAVSAAPITGGTGIGQSGPQDVWAVAGSTIAHYPDLPLFRDVLGDHPFYPFVQALACRGLISGYTCGGPGEPCDPQQRPYYRPGGQVTRGQTAKIVANAANFQDPMPTTQQTFADVPPSQPFWLWVERIAGRGIISGYTCGGPGEPCDPQQRPYFRAYNDVTRGQLAKIVSSAANFQDPVPTTQQTFADVPPTQPFWLWVERVAGRGIISGYTCGGPGEPCDPQNRPYFRPGNPSTRAQTAKVVVNTFFSGAQ